MKKKILQVTLFDNNNIGNRLQCYALYKQLSNEECDVALLRDRKDYVPIRNDLLKNQVKHVLGLFGNKKYQQKYLAWKGRIARQAAMRAFSESHLGKVIDASDGTDGIDFSSYDLGIVGSDQVWHHWNDNDNELPFFYLEFLPPEKRAAYGASFGFDQFREDDFQQHKDGLNHMKYISCRETRGCELVKEVTGRDVSHVLDPTLLLDASEWEKLETSANAFVKSQHDYIFIYFLGNITEEYQAEIEKKANGKKIINFGDLTDMDIASCGPIEFLYLIHHADYILTDSFHGTVFCTIFNKPFTVFRRKQEGFENMFGRIEDLLKSTDQCDHAYGGIDQSVKVDSFETIKDRSLVYLNHILQ